LLKPPYYYFNVTSKNTINNAFRCKKASFYTSLINGYLLLSQ